MKTLLRRYMAHFLYYTQLLWLLAAVTLPNRIVVLTYHRVLPETADAHSNPGIVVSPATFGRHLQFLQKHFTVLSADAFLRVLREGSPVPRRACLVTFDDGWRDNFTYALPLLESHRVPILLFVATRFVGSANCFWQERTARRLLTLARAGTAGRAALEEIGVECPRDGVAGKALKDWAISATGRIKALPRAELENRLARLDVRIETMPRLSEDLGDDRFLDWDELQTMLATGLVSIGTHAATHRPLTTLSAAEVQAELQESIETIRHRLGIAPRLFAYPNGDVDDVAATASSDAGMQAAFTTQPGHVRPGTDRQRLPRVNVHDGAAATESELLFKILSAR